MPSGSSTPPVEVVDFILKAADHASRTHLGSTHRRRCAHPRRIHRHRHLYHPTSAIRVYHPGDLVRKYSKELHANEITLLAYYIAAVNIETTYHALDRQNTDTSDYQPFPGIVLADTFQIHEADDTLDAEIFAANNNRITTELDTPSASSSAIPIP